MDTARTRMTRDGIRLYDTDEFAGMQEAGRVAALLLDLSGSLGEAESAIRRLRSTPMFDATFVVALVASAMPEERDRHLRLGYDAVLAKPFARQTLLEVLAPIKR